MVDVFFNSLQQREDRFLILVPLIIKFMECLMVALVAVLWRHQCLTMGMPIVHVHVFLFVIIEHLYTML